MFDSLGFDFKVEIRHALNRPLPNSWGKPVGELFGRWCHSLVPELLRLGTRTESELNSRGAIDAMQYYLVGDGLIPRDRG